MASVLWDGGVSGPQLLISGNPWSGQIVPVGGIQLIMDRNNSGNIYVGFSGNITRTSGNVPLSGSSLSDGMQVGPGGSYFVPKIALRAVASGAGGAGSGMNLLFSGTTPWNIFILGDATCSGQGRVYWEGM